MTYRRRRSLVGFLFIAPALIFFTAFSFVPMISAGRLSLTNYDLMTQPSFIGLDNYRDLLTSTSFLNAARTTALYVLGVNVPIWTLSLGLALLLNQNLRTRSFFRGLFFSPIVLPLAVLAVVWALLYHPYGPINTVVLSPFVKQTIPWLNSTQYALLAVVVMAIWRSTGYYAILFLAGLQNIPTEYYEAAKLDGASTLNQFRFVTWPLLRPTTLFVVVISIINALRHFDAIWVMTGGGPVDATTVLAILIYQTGLVFFQMGKASAISIFLFLAVLIFTVIQLRLFRQND